MAGRSSAFLLPSTVVFIYLMFLGLVAADARPLHEENGMGTMMTRTLATSSDDVSCPVQLADCYADASCTTCVEEVLSNSAGCAEEFANGDGLVPCGEAQDFHCCALAYEDQNCENDTRFARYLECALEALNPQCDDNFVDISECSGASGLAFSLGAFSVFNLTAVAGLFIAAFGFVA